MGIYGVYYASRWAVEPKPKYKLHLTTSQAFLRLEAEIFAIAD